jgi:TRAP-type C4-dicarboxylate transport system permease large subunit
VPQAITAFFPGLSGSPAALLFSITFVLIVAGCFLHGDPLILIVVPLVLPAVASFGINLIHFGMLVVFCVAIGQQTPPVGSTLFVVSAIAELDIMTVTRSNLWFILLFILLAAVLILIPELALFLPRLVYPNV